MEVSRCDKTVFLMIEFWVC